jgi:aryl-alcohol dehydrogenase-like predicted oxidoreductase
MEYRTLGRTGLKVSLIGLGTMTWGNQNTEAQGHEQMDYAVTQGINFFDTAEMYAVPPSAKTYGTTDSIIGTWFKKNKNRDKIILASKIAGPGLGWIRGGKAVIDRKNIEQAIEDSLKRLQTDYIDLYQLHWPNREDYHFGNFWNYGPNFDTKETEENFLEVLEALGDQVKAGKIRHAGLSNETAWGTMKYLELAEKYNLPRMQSIQNEYSLLCRRFDTDLSEIAVHEDCGLLAWSPLCRGILSGKYLDGARPPGARLSMETRMEHRDGEATNAAVKAYIGVAKKYGLDVCQMALAFVNAKPFVTSTLIGATTMEQLKTNIDSIKLKLSNDVLADIAKVRRQYPVPY